MEKIVLIKKLADEIFASDEKCITNEEFEYLTSIANSQDEFDLYANLYNFFLKKKSEEVIKNGKF